MATLTSFSRTTPRKMKRVGRGQSSGRGKTSGRGTKGQNARAGRKKRPEIRDFIKKLPKRRGYGKNRARGVVGDRVRPQEVTLASISKHFTAGETVSPQALIEKGVLGLERGKVPTVKIIGTGDVNVKVTVSGCGLTKGAKAAIEAAGGTVA